MKVKSYLYLLLSYLVALLGSYLCFIELNKHLDILLATLIADIVCTIIIFIFSVIANNSSIYDPYWSLIPPFILILWMKKLNRNSYVEYLIFAVYLFWSLRLTLNCLIAWKGLKHEDWRYQYFRNKTGKYYWLVSFLGIHFFPTLIVFLSMLPIYFGFRHEGRLIIQLYVFGVCLGIGSVIISLLSDIALYKHRNSDKAHTSIRTGLWKFSRHPNYLGELLFWFSNYLIGLSYNINNYFTIAGFIAMVLLFNLYSIPAMEKRLLQRKPDYQEIINTIPRLLPIKFNSHQKRD